MKSDDLRAVAPEQGLGRVSPVTKRAFAHRPALSSFRDEALDELLGGVHRYFDLLREDKPSVAAYVAAWAVVPDLLALELQPGLSPGVRRRRHAILRIFTNPYLRRGMAGYAALDRIEVAVCDGISDLFYRRGIHALFPRAQEHYFEE